MLVRGIGFALYEAKGERAQHGNRIAGGHCVRCLIVA